MVTLCSCEEAFNGSWITFAVTFQYKWSDLNSMRVREILFRQLPRTNMEETDEVKYWGRDLYKDKVETLCNTQENQHYN